jgi:hypothetical protein
VWNVDFNNSKILFTVVYIPMLMFCFIKVALIYAMITLANLSMTFKATRIDNTSK